MYIYMYVCMYECMYGCIEFTVMLNTYSMLKFLVHKSRKVEGL